MKEGKMVIKEIKVNRIRPNPWNPNLMSMKTEEALNQSVKSYGFIDPITVRRVKEDEFDFEIIDGEHRWGVARFRDIETLPAIILDLSDVQAKKLTIIQNELKGRPEVPSLAELLEDIQNHSNPDEFLHALPYDPVEVEELFDKAERLKKDHSINEVEPGYVRVILKIPEAKYLHAKLTLTKWIHNHCPDAIMVTR